MIDRPVIVGEQVLYAAAILADALSGKIAEPDVIHAAVDTVHECVRELRRVPSGVPGTLPVSLPDVHPR